MNKKNKEYLIQFLEEYVEENIDYHNGEMVNKLNEILKEMKGGKK